MFTIFREISQYRVMQTRTEYYDFLDAVKEGDLVKMEILKEKGCYEKNGTWLKDDRGPWDEDTFSEAAINGNIKVMKWLKEQ